MSLLQLIYLAIGGLLVRELLVLTNVLTSCRFLRRGQHPVPSEVGIGFRPTFHIVLPVLREASGLKQALAHFEALSKGHPSKVIVVTTARERAEASEHAEAADTVATAAELARSGNFVHLYYPDPQGLKADQLNFAIDSCVMSLSAEPVAHDTFIVVYDIDSRPPLDTLTRFEQVIAQHPDVDVFHQSSRFELRASAINTHETFLNRLKRGAVDSGTLRANRFVLAYELPRLLHRSNPTGFWINRLNSFVYVHVTGHGLCIRLSLLKELPFPPRSPLEDMHYSFLLDSRNTFMVPIASLDCVEVPASLSAQFKQLSRWFLGPGRFLQYLSDPRAQKGWRSRLVAVSAAGITIQWLSCAFVLTLLGVILWLGNGVTRVLILVLLATYGAQLIIVDYVMATAGDFSDRALRILMYPIAFTIYGLAGLVGVGHLLHGNAKAGKTERNGSPL